MTKEIKYDIVNISDKSGGINIDEPISYIVLTLIVIILFLRTFDKALKEKEEMKNEKEFFKRRF